MNKQVINLSKEDAKSFFVQQDSYCNFDLPSYFDFESVLRAANIELTKRTISECTRNYKIYKNNPKKNKKREAKYYADVNCVIMDNKDGKHAWRPMTLIHPMIYINLVNIITEEANWKELQKHFSTRKTPGITCCSIPIVAKNNQYKNVILNWWNSFEQKSLSLLLKYRCMAKADITNCYGSIYTHSIEWALQGKEKVKYRRQPWHKKGSFSSLGKDLDLVIESMQSGQTNGIPQGSVLMDFIAEIVLTSIDKDLCKSLKKLSIIANEDYKILRYRDDYRIFSNSRRTLELILNELNKSLCSYGLALNSKKTSIASDPILESLKNDKVVLINSNLNLPLFSLNIDKMVSRGLMYKNYQKILFQIYDYAEKFENCGQLKRLMIFYHNIIGNKQFKTTDAIPLISVLTKIAYHNPKVYPQYIALVSLLIKNFSAKAKNHTLQSIISTFSNVTNTDFLDVWIQRLAYPTGIPYEGKSPICMAVVKHPDFKSIWNNDWLLPSIAKKIQSCDIVNRQILSTISPQVSRVEIDKFKNAYPDEA